MSDGFPPLDTFLQMEDEEVAGMVSKCAGGEVCVLVPDGSRKAGLVFWDLDPSKVDFHQDLFNRMHSMFLDVVSMFFDHGIKVLLIPILTKKNFGRGKSYMEPAVRDGAGHFFNDPLWLEFYEKRRIRVRFYGDRSFIRENGYDFLMDWVEDIERRTANYDRGILYLGFACDRSLEEVRLSSIGAEIHRDLGRDPTREELVQEYYGQEVRDIGLFIRPTEVRDSDMLPVLISGYKTQMYFPVSPVEFLTKRIIRLILYDTLVTRVVSGGSKMYSKTDMDNVDLQKVKRYYRTNRDVVLGLGHREGPFWLMMNDIKEDEKGDEEMEQADR